MNKLLPILCVGFFTLSPKLPAETVFGPGVVNIATNEAILINLVRTIVAPGGNDCYIDGLLTSFPLSMAWGGMAIAGPRQLVLSNRIWVTFQRLQGSSVKTLLVKSGETDGINVPAGKTIQFFEPMGMTYSAGHMVRPPNSAGYPLFGESQGRAGIETVGSPTVTGPAEIGIAGSSTHAALISYYFTDEVLQLPPGGFTAAPAPALEINIEKSFDLTNWVPTGAFNTSAEAGAFYRLRILK
ncbi:MAG TPA: hypothetical protein VI136_09865 [Verrucomicrobiae bacterium]